MHVKRSLASHPSSTKEHLFVAFECGGIRLSFRVRWLWRGRIFWQNGESFSHSADVFCRLWYFEAGGATLLLSDGKAIRVDAGQICLMPSGLPFCVRYDAGAVVRTLHLSIEYPPGEPVFSESVKVFLFDSTGEHGALIRHLESGDRLSEVAAVFGIVREALRDISEELVRHAERSAHFSRLFGFVASSTAIASIRIEDLARLYGVTPNALSKRFSRIMGYSIKAFLLRETLRRAKEKIAGSEDSVERIALELGFVSVPYFFRVYKQQTGMPPLEYRKQAGWLGKPMD